VFDRRDIAIVWSRCVPPIHSLGVECGDRRLRGQATGFGLPALYF
jgi:hypothetical protein